MALHRSAAERAETNGTLQNGFAAARNGRRFRHGQLEDASLDKEVPPVGKREGDLHVLAASLKWSFGVSQLCLDVPINSARLIKALDVVALTMTLRATACSTRVYRWMFLPI